MVEAVAEEILVWGVAEEEVVAGSSEEVALPLMLEGLLMLGDHQVGVVLTLMVEEVVPAPLPSVAELQMFEVGEVDFPSVEVDDPLAQEEVELHVGEELQEEDEELCEGEGDLVEDPPAKFHHRKKSLQ